MAELTGWSRTFVLSLGALAGVMATAEVIHLLKGGKGQGRLNRE